MKRLRAKKYNIGDCSEVCDVIFFIRKTTNFLHRYELSVLIRGEIYLGRL